MKRGILDIFIPALATAAALSCNPDHDRHAAADLASEGSANCYVVTVSGEYSFPAVKGNSTESVGNVASVQVLWESFGTAVAPKEGELVSEVTYKDGRVSFKASGKEGNALIAAKDAGGNILWSWHIWMTDEPQEQVYANNAGVMMDRNLGATSAEPGDWEACGLMYQWGRKDPFPGACGKPVDEGFSSIKAATSTPWPNAVKSDGTTGTIGYATAHPMTFIIEDASNRDWLYTGDHTVDKSRWQSTKTIYDPCPPGWMIPQAGPDGIWEKALNVGNVTEGYEDLVVWDGINRGCDFSKGSSILGNDGPVWYPAAGLTYSDDGVLRGAGELGGIWSTTSSTNWYVTVFCFYQDGYILPALDSYRAHGCSARCQKI